MALTDVMKMAQAMLKNCPVCNKPAVEAYRPFCCARGANVDLGRWMGESYKVPTNDPSPKALAKGEAPPDDMHSNEEE